MSECICPSDGRKVPSDKRVFVLPPDMEVEVNGVVKRDKTKLIIFHKDCPVHGYSETTND